MSGERGPVPTLCPSCRHASQLGSNRRYKDRNPEIVQKCRDAIDKEAERLRHRKRYAANREVMAVRRRHQYVTNQKATAAEKLRLYRLANPGKHAEQEQRRRARKLAAFVAPVDPDVIYERDGGICQLCGEPVDRSVATIDHIIPFARGGTHEPANVQLAHGPCNSRKGSKLMAPTKEAW